MLVSVLPDELAFTELLKVLIIGPERKVLALALIARHLIQDAKVSCAIFGTELVRDLLEQLLLFLSQALKLRKGSEV